MPKSKFNYVIYIATTAETLWKALLDGEFTRQYWGHENVSDWQQDSDWEHRRVGALRAVVLGVVVAASAPSRLVITWADPRDRGRNARQSRVSFDIETFEGMVRVTVKHEDLGAGSKMERKVSQAWARALPSLKSLYKSGHPPTA